MTLVLNYQKNNIYKIGRTLVSLFKKTVKLPNLMNLKQLNQFVKMRILVSYNIYKYIDY